jgi:predicted MFS family arabinose efflux permease
LEADLQARHASVLPGDEQYAEGYVRYVVALLALVLAVSYMDRLALSVLLPLLKAELHLSDSQLGLLVGLAFSIFYAVCGLPIAWIADRSSRRNVIVAALAVWSVVTALGGTVHNFWQLLLARIGVGVGEAGCIPISQSLICDYVPVERRAGMFAYQMLGITIGTAGGMSLAGWLGSSVGWRWTFVLLGIPGLLLAILVRLTLKEPRRGRLDGSIAPPADGALPHMLRTIFGTGTYVLLLVFVVGSGFFNVGLFHWLPSYYSRVFEIPLSQIGVYVGVATGVGQGMGLLLGGTLSNTVSRRGPGASLFLGAVSTCFAVPFGLFAVLVNEPYWSIVSACVMSTLAGIGLGPAVAGMFNVINPSMRITAGALSTFMQSMVGFSLGPLVVGMLSDHFAPTLGVLSLRYALLAPIAILPVMAIAQYAAGKRLPHDLRKLGGQ